MSISGSVIICDDIRQETTGKVILVGVYAENLVVPSLPVSLSLSFWIRLKRVEPGLSELTVRIGANDKKQHEAKITIDVPDDVPDVTGNVNIYLQDIPIRLERDSDIFLELDGLSDGTVIRETLPASGAPRPPTTD